MVVNPSLDKGPFKGESNIPRVQETFIASPGSIYVDLHNITIVIE